MAVVVGVALFGGGGGDDDDLATSSVPSTSRRSTPEEGAKVAFMVIEGKLLS